MEPRPDATPTVASKPSKITAGSLAAAAIIAAVVAVQAPRTAQHEGTRYTAYQDPAKIWTICNGRTTNVKAGDRATAAQCQAWLKTELAEHMTAVAKDSPELLEQPAALAQAGDFHYNAGPRWWLASPMRTHFRARRWREGCEAFRGYIVKARAPQPIRGTTCAINSKGVRFCDLPGLVKRREDERRLCLAGLTS